MRECELQPSDQFLKAVAQFNDGEYFECHETLEELWMDEMGEMRDFYQGLLQIAVALHHWKNGNLGGALSLLKGGAEYLERVSGVCLGVDVVRVVEAAGRVRESLQHLGKERMAQLEPSLLPVLRERRL